MKGTKPSLVALLVAGGASVAFAFFAKDPIRDHHIVMGLQGVLLLFVGVLLWCDIHNYNAFLKYLRKAPHRWKLTPLGVIITTENDHYPLTAVYAIITEGVTSDAEREIAKEILGLTAILEERIQKATLNEPGHDPVIRRTLLAATGLG